MTKKLLFLLCASSYLLFPQLSLGFSETEIDSLQSSGGKNFPSRPWRTQISFSLKRNLEIRNSLAVNIDFNEEASLLDPSNWYYGFGLTISYSLKEASKNFKYDFIKNAEVFLSGSFDSPFTGHESSNISNYKTKDYIKYALRDVVTGFTTPIYKSDDLLSYFDFSVILPLSRFSEKAGLFTTLNGSVNLLYFLKKQDKWNLALSSSHGLAYNRYTKAYADDGGYEKNIQGETNHNLNLIYRQKYYKSLPASTQISVSYYLGLSTTEDTKYINVLSYTQNHFLTLSGLFSWKLKERLYFNFSIRWKDKFFVYNPYDETIGKGEELLRFTIHRTFFSLGGSYSF